jgi:hypothetical protein
MYRASSLLFSTLLFSLFAAAQNPAPFLNQPLVPEAATPGSAGFTLTLNGTGFVSGAVVNWNGSPLATTFVNGSQLTATVPASDIATPSTATVTVTNPSPGGGTSNIQYFTVSTPATSLAFAELTTTLPLSTCTGAATADFNGDGKTDVAYSCNLTKSAAMEIALGSGDGTFQAPVAYALNFTEGAFAIPLINVFLGSFTSGGNLDIAGVSADPGTDGTPQYFLGNGNGTFQNVDTLNVIADQIAAGDFNKDGNLDLAAASNLPSGGTSGGITILLGNGDGTFQTGATYDSTVRVDSLAVGDFDGDGNLDIAYVAISNTGPELRFLKGNGDGTFQAPTSMASPDLTKLIAADVNGDGKLDLVGILQGSTNTGLTVFIGKGDGTFQAPVAYGTIPYPQDLIVRDVNADGKLDATVLDQQPDIHATGNGAIYFLQGNGDGTFQNP